jgi:NAD(P)-dependent dehydrogenase (short-subunit alcohol dehydrogenase family)
MFRLDGKVALVSGAARGIGAEAARRLAAAGARVVVADILDDLSQAVAAGIGAAAVPAHLDVRREADWQAAIGAAVGRFGGLDILVNNAGILLGKGSEESTLEDWHQICGVNLTGVFLGTRLAVPALRERAKTSPQGSSIVNVASTAGLVGSPLAPLYSLTKGGVTLFSKSTALEFARKSYRIRVNSIHPGVIDTDMGQQTFEIRARNAGDGDLAAARLRGLATHPIGRFGTAGDIANGIVFLASDESGFMTGSSLVMDGGVTAQ